MEENNVEVLPEQEAPQEDVVLSDVNSEQPAQAHADNAADVNLVKMREAKEKAERESAQMASKLAEYERQRLQAQQPVQEEPKDPVIADDDFVDGRQLRKIEERRQREHDALKKQLQYQSDKANLTARYSDYDKVVNENNLKELARIDPETSAVFSASIQTASLYDVGVATYKRIKELGIGVEDNHQHSKGIAQANAAKPKPANSVSPQQGSSPLTQANAFATGRLNQAAKDHYWEQTQKAIKEL